MTIEVTAYASTTLHRGVDLGGKFAQTRLSNRAETGIPPIAHSFIDARVTPIGKSRDCVWTVITVQIRVMLEMELDSAKIDRGWFAPGDGDPHGYEADAPRSPDDWRLDERNVRVHEESHAQDIVRAVEEAARAQLNRPGVQEQLTIQHRCDDEEGAYQVLHRLVGERVAAMGMDAFERQLDEFERHRTGSDTERRARRAQITEHAQRE